MSDEKKVLFNSGNVLVYEEQQQGETWRNLALGPRFSFRQGAMRLSQPEHLCLEYYRNLFAGVAQARQLRRVLVLGVGTAAIARAIRAVYGEQIEIDLVDINEAIFTAAVRHFELAPGAAQMFVADAAVFVQSEQKPYDYICVDIWDDTGVPPWMLEAPFWHGVGRLCAPGAAVSVNVPAHLHQALGFLLASLHPHVLTLQGHNAAFVVPMGTAPHELPGAHLPPALNEAYLRLGVDLAAIWAQALILRKA